MSCLKSHIFPLATRGCPGLVQNFNSSGPPVASPQTSGSGPRHPRLLLQPPHAVTLPHHGAVKTVDSLRVADLLPRILAQCRLDVADDVDWRIVLASLSHLPQRGVEAEHQEDTQPDSHPDDEAKQGRGNEHVQSGDHLQNVIIAITSCELNQFLITCSLNLVSAVHNLGLGASILVRLSPGNCIGIRT